MKNARIVMLVFLVLVLLVALVSCSVDAGSGTTDAGNTGGGTHAHTYADAWTSDADYHWHAATCGHADEVKDKAAHTYENGACTVCGRAEPVHKHTYADAWTSDAEYHWHAATCGHADEVKDKAARTYENGACAVRGRAEHDGDLDPSAKFLEYLPLPDGTWSVSAGQAKLLDKIVIPDTWQGKAVTAISAQGFYHCANLTGITIPDCVTNIGNSAFSGCTSLTSITILEGVTSIGDSAFRGCTSLTSVTIPSSVTRIGNYAFRDCTRLTTIRYNGTKAESEKKIASGTTTPVRTR